MSKRGFCSIQCSTVLYGYQKRTMILLCFVLASKRGSLINFHLVDVRLLRISFSVVES